MGHMMSDTTQKDDAATPIKPLTWDNYAPGEWSASRNGKLLCRIRCAPKSDRWMLLRIEDDIGLITAWHGDYESLDEAKQAAAKL